MMNKADSRKPRREVVSNIYVPPPARKLEQPANNGVDATSKERVSEVKTRRLVDEDTKICNNSSLLFKSDAIPIQGNSEALKKKKKKKAKKEKRSYEDDVRDLPPFQNQLYSGSAVTTLQPIDQEWVWDSIVPCRCMVPPVQVTCQTQTTFEPPDDSEDAETKIRRWLFSTSETEAAASNAILSSNQEPESEMESDVEVITKDLGKMNLKDECSGLDLNKASVESPSFQNSLAQHAVPLDGNSQTPAVKNETPNVSNEASAVNNETTAVNDEAPDDKTETPAVKNETPAVSNETPPVTKEISTNSGTERNKTINHDTVVDKINKNEEQWNATDGAKSKVLLDEEESGEEDDEFEWEKLLDEGFQDFEIPKGNKVSSKKVRSIRASNEELERAHNDCSIIEIYGFSPDFKTQDLLIAFTSFVDRGFKLRWVDDTHALGIFPSPAIADEALTSRFANVLVRPLSQATQASREKAKNTVLPSSLRPKTCPALARRLVSGALGVRAVFTQAERDAERAILNEAREQKRLAAKQREAAWEGRFD